MRGGSMIEITPISTMPPIKKIKRIIREDKNSPDKQPSQEHEDKELILDDSEPQHIDEIV